MPNDKSTAPENARKVISLKKPKSPEEEFEMLLRRTAARLKSRSLRARRKQSAA
jgi:hypothetical protein